MIPAPLLRGSAAHLLQAVGPVQCFAGSTTQHSTGPTACLREKEGGGGGQGVGGGEDGRHMREGEGWERSREGMGWEGIGDRGGGRREGARCSCALLICTKTLAPPLPCAWHLLYEASGFTHCSVSHQGEIQVLPLGLPTHPPSPQMYTTDCPACCVAYVTPTPLPPSLAHHLTRTVRMTYRLTHS